MKPYRRDPPNALATEGSVVFERPQNPARKKNSKLRFKSRGFVIVYNSCGHPQVHRYYRDKKTMLQALRALERNCDYFSYLAIDLNEYPRDLAGHPAIRARFTRKKGTCATSREETCANFRRLIAQAMEQRSKIEIVYQDIHNQLTKRTIHPDHWIAGDLFTALCELRGDWRDFRGSRIQKCCEMK